MTLYCLNIKNDIICNILYCSFFSQKCFPLSDDLPPSHELLSIYKVSIFG